MKNNEQIKEAPVIELVEDIDEEINGRLNKFWRLLESLKERPDAEAKLAQVDATLKALASTDEKQAYLEKCQQAAEDLATAFALIEQHREVIPAEFYNPLNDAICQMITESDWHSDPTIMEEALPSILRRALWLNRPEGLN